MTGFKLDPQMRGFIDRYLEVSSLSTATSVSQQRSDYDRVVQHFRHAHPPGISCSESVADGRHGKIPLRRYRYRDDNDDALVMFIHGGGFILGGLDSHDDICAELCAATGYELVSVDYRLSPEHFHPIHLDDIEDAFDHCRQDNVILVGVSAGGTLAAALCQRLRLQPRKPAGQVLIYPSLGGDCFDLDSYRVNADAPLLKTSDILFYRGARCETDTLPMDDPEFYPLVADDFAATPPTIAFSADIDPLRDDASLYVSKLRDAGVAAEWINEPGLVHDFLRARHSSDAAAAAFQRICAAITRLARQNLQLRGHNT
ncbi:MAG: alpha/beta hydrolase [Gammaproteobacteria bacterium]|nr:alpha/beta hydrolase [Gammaproteobacteria bacterium]